MSLSIVDPPKSRGFSEEDPEPLNGDRLKISQFATSNEEFEERKVKKSQPAAAQEIEKRKPPKTVFGTKSVLGHLSVKDRKMDRKFPVKGSRQATPIFGKSMNYNLAAGSQLHKAV